MAAKLGAGFAKQFGGVNKEILVPHLNNWFVRGKFPDEIQVSIYPNKQPDTAFHPSSDTLDCARVLFAKRNGQMEETKFELPVIKGFFYGHYVHALIYFILQDLGFAKEEDIEFPFAVQDEESGLEIKGHIDVVECWIPGQDDPYMVDIKTQQGFAFNKAAEETSRFDKYVAQLRMYLYFKKMKKAIILWAEKDQPHAYKETIVEADDSQAEEIIEKWMLVAEAETAGSIPPCTCGMGQSCPAWGLLTNAY